MANGRASAFIKDLLKLPQEPIDEQYYFYGGIALILAYALAALLLLLQQNLSDYRELTIACIVTGLGLEDCHREAVKAAWVTVAALMSAVVISPYLIQVLLPSVTSKPADYSLLLRVSLLLLLPVLCMHYVFSAYGNAYLSRLKTIEHESVFISLENLLWPVILQCLVLERDKKRYLILLLAMLNITILTPYRGMLLVLIIFGLGIPLAVMALRGIGKKAGNRRRNFYANGLLGVMLISLLATNLYQDSEARAFYTDTRSSRILKTANELANSAHVTGSTVPALAVPYDSQIMHRLKQRLTYPFYQAVMAKYLTEYMPPPDLRNEFLGRLRVSHEKTLNQMLYERIYQSENGETTFQFYGEAAAYANTPPFFWCITVPLLFSVVFAVFYRFAMPAGLLLGVAAWRGSMSGLFNILPSLTVQLGMVVCCLALQKLTVAWKVRYAVS